MSSDNTDIAIEELMEKVLRLFEETKQLSVTDGITGLHSTRYLYKQLRAKIARMSRMAAPVA